MVENINKTKKNAQTHPTVASARRAEYAALKIVGCKPPAIVDDPSPSSPCSPPRDARRNKAVHVNNTISTPTKACGA